MNPHGAYPVSDHCDGHSFFNPGHRGLPRLRDVLRWKLTSRPAAWPKQVDIIPSSRGPLADTACRTTWINHASFLLESSQGNFLIDPVFSSHCGPFGLIGPPRVHPPGIPLNQLPKIHFVLLSHDHYDHCDLPTLRTLARVHQPVAITPLGNRRLLERAGFSRIIELDWWQAHAPAAPDVRITVTPTQHWSKRLSSHRCSRLWGGFYIRLGRHRVYFVGDTGYHETLFREVGRRLGPSDLALVPIGAYEPRWFMREQHCDPAEAVQIHRNVAARVSIAMHWGTFQLTDESREEQVRALVAARSAAGLTPNDFRILEPGGNMVVSN